MKEILKRPALPRSKPTVGVVVYESVLMKHHFLIASRVVNIPFRSLSYACRWNKKIGVA